MLGAWSGDDRPSPFVLFHGAGAMGIGRQGRCQACLAGPRDCRNPTHCVVEQGHSCAHSCPLSESAGRPHARLTITPLRIFIGFELSLHLLPFRSLSVQLRLQLCNLREDEFGAANQSAGALPACKERVTGMEVLAYEVLSHKGAPLPLSLLTLGSIGCRYPLMSD